MNHTYYIGVDCGKNTGVALYYRNDKKFKEVFTTDFWGFFDWLGDITNKAALDSEHEYHFKFWVENPSLVSGIFQHQEFSKAKNNKIAENVGRVKRESELLILGLREMNYEVTEVKPTKGMTKLNAEYVKRLTGWTKQTNQHSRDAIMLVAGR